MRYGTKYGSNCAATASCYKRILYNILSNVTYWSSHRQADAPTINIQSTRRTAPICVNMFHCTVILFGSNGNSYTVCTQSHMWVIYTHVFTIQRRWSG
jgi:hypothetical protein